MKVSAIVAGRSGPSSRLRFKQHINALASEGIDVRLHASRVDKYAGVTMEGASGATALMRRGSAALITASKYATRLGAVAHSWSADVTWLERDLISLKSTFVPLLHRPLVIDVDDAIWLSGAPANVARNARLADLIIAGNEFIADWFAKHARRVTVVPTAVDTKRLESVRNRERLSRFTIVWTGSRTTHIYLEAIIPAIASFFRERDAQLVVVSDLPPRLVNLPQDRVRFVRWSEENEAKAMSEASVGVMPLFDDDWSRGKCSYKMLHYMACSLPVVVTPVGTNARILSEAEVGFGASTAAQWVDALEALHANHQLAARLGQQGRALAEARYSVEVVSKQIATALRSVR